MFTSDKYSILLMIALCGSVLENPLVMSVPHGKRNSMDSFLWSIRKRPSLFNKRSGFERFRSFSCAGRADKLYPDTNMNCQTYYRCLEGVAYANACPRNEAFDTNSNECLPQSEVNCVNNSLTTKKCYRQPDGFYPNYEDNCSSYYSCYNGTVLEEATCPVNSLWDSATGSCSSGLRVSCSPPSCKGLDDGLYPLEGSACTAYYSCKHGRRTDMLCSLGSVFDYMKKQCISGPNAVCYEKACEERVNGLHAAPQAPCDTYYECFNGAMIRLQKCSKGQIFDGKQCVEQSTFTCIRREAGQGTCVQHVDGTYASEDPQCRGFFFCRNSQLVRHFQCNYGLVFNGRSCVDNSNFICTSRPPVPDCYRKFDGYYNIERTGCNRFYRCINSQKVSEHSCPSDYVFNGRQCVHTRLYSCPSKSNRDIYSQ